MEAVFQMAERIAGELKKSGQFKEYMSAKQRILNNPELKTDIEKYKKANFDYQSRLMNNEQPSFEEEKAVSSIYWKLMNNADAKNYLESEKSLVQSLNRIYTIIGGACDIDLYMPES